MLTKFAALFFRNPTRTKSPRLSVEGLESRTLPAAANYFVLDFTPDYHAGSFRDTFYYVKKSNGQSPAFLDINRDGRISDSDVSLAAQQVTNRVKSFYAPFLQQSANHLSIQYGDVLTQNYWGYNSLRFGMANTNALVSVMYFGGTSTAGASRLGYAPLAGEGQNSESYGETYTRTIALSLLSNPNTTSAQFVDKVAATAAHELGHMMGLRHSVGNSSNIMNATISSNPGATSFVNGWQNTVVTVNNQQQSAPQQHAYRELAYSFQTNQTQSPRSTTGLGATTSSLGGQWLHDEGDNACDYNLGAESQQADLNIRPDWMAPETQNHAASGHSVEPSLARSDSVAITVSPMAASSNRPDSASGKFSLGESSEADTEGADDDALGRWSGVNVM